MLRHQHHETVDEQRVADAAQGVQAEDQRIDAAGDGHAEEQQVDADPPACAEHHDASGTEHLGKHAGGPSARRGEQTVHGDQQRSLG